MSRPKMVKNSLLRKQSSSFLTSDIAKEFDSVWHSEFATNSCNLYDVEISKSDLFSLSSTKLYKITVVTVGF